MKNLVILPSYNEAENITNLIGEIIESSKDLDVLVVDDNSPDGTAKVIESYRATLPAEKAERVILKVREKKDGRGGAVRDGLEWGLTQKRYANFVEMDCDFSHHPKYLPQGFAMLAQSDVVLGSRYPNGQIVGWPLKRKLLSFFANQLARTLISRRVKDYTNGFRFYSAKGAAYLCGFQQKNKGFIYLSETLAHLLRGGYKIESFPIVFVNRERGVSNTTFMEVYQSFSAIFSIGWDYRFGKSAS